MIPSRYNTWSYQVRRFYLEKHMVIRTHWARGGNKYVTLYFVMSCWEKSASLFLIFLFLLLVCNSLGHVANRPDYHVNLILPHRFFDNLRPQSYLKASVFFLGEAILPKAWTEDPRVAKVYIFVENRITYGASVDRTAKRKHYRVSQKFMPLSI